MDDRRFDVLTRALGSGLSRRQAIKAVFGLGSGVVAGARVVTDDAQAARRGYPGPLKPAPGEGGCATGFEPCGSECCSSWFGQSCCNGSCCDGQCDSQGQCCIHDLALCDGVCMPPGGCCTAYQCDYRRGWTCRDNRCVFG